MNSEAAIFTLRHRLFYDCSEPGAHPRPLGAQHLHLQPQDVPGHRRAFKACRAVDQQQEGGLLQVSS